MTDRMFGGEFALPSKPYEFISFRVPPVGLHVVDAWDVTAPLSAVLAAGVAPWVMATAADYDSWKIGALAALIGAARPACLRYRRLRLR
ncbi:hypothetical protein ACIRPK_33840 [Kitasatospora sp. NPDC101801]|uniref:hypothetical protein n=1 Tax=Kitasatospora sp. NPDC101801 TaxID=3364103 RepID=UPI0037F3AF5D